MPDCSHPVIYCNGNSGAHVQGGRQLDLTSTIDDSIQVWRPVVESAWLSLPAPCSLAIEHSSSKVSASLLGGSL